MALDRIKTARSGRIDAICQSIKIGAAEGATSEAPKCTRSHLRSTFSFTVYLCSPSVERYQFSSERKNALCSLISRMSSIEPIMDSFDGSGCLLIVLNAPSFPLFLFVLMTFDHRICARCLQLSTSLGSAQPVSPLFLPITHRLSPSLPSRAVATFSGVSLATCT